MPSFPQCSASHTANVWSIITKAPSATSAWWLLMKIATVAAEEITKLIAKIKVDEKHFAQLLGKIAKLKGQGQLDDEDPESPEKKRLARAERQRAVYETRIRESRAEYVKSLIHCRRQSKNL